MIALDRDTDTGSAAFQTREVILQNWRADVVALTSSTGDLLERITDDRSLSEGGIPFATHPTDLTAPAKGGATSATAGYGTPSGVVNNDDYLYFLTLYGLGDWRADWNRDGVVDTDDHTAFYTQWAAAAGSWGRGVLSNRGNILGYAGYVHEPATGAAGGGHGTMWHVRHRVLHAGLGRWIQRDPAGYPEGPNLYWYGASNPIGMLDAMGLACAPGFHTDEGRQCRSAPNVKGLSQAGEMISDYSEQADAMQPRVPLVTGGCTTWFKRLTVTNPGGTVSGVECMYRVQFFCIGNPMRVPELEACCRRLFRKLTWFPGYPAVPSHLVHYIFEFTCLRPLSPNCIAVASTGPVCRSITVPR